jgi:hypothetical protein
LTEIERATGVTKGVAIGHIFRARKAGDPRFPPRPPKPKPVKARRLKPVDEVVGNRMPPPGAGACGVWCSTELDRDGMRCGQGQPAQPLDEEPLAGDRNDHRRAARALTLAGCALGVWLTKRGGQHGNGADYPRFWPSLGPRACGESSFTLGRVRPSLTTRSSLAAKNR